MKKKRNIQKVLASLLCLTLVFSLFVSLGTTSVSAATWTGKWIWQSVDGPINTFVSFRKTVSLSAKPTSAIANIAAENEYWLYVNGTLVVKEGGIQCRPDFTNTYYDSLDIASYLVSGNNTIAVLVWYKGGNDSYTQRMVSKGGFFFECNLSGATPAKIVSDSSWKMKVNPAFNVTTQLKNPDGSYKWVAYPISYDARNELSGWYTTSYSDTAWATATEKGVPPTAPWNDLKPRTIPFWKDYGLTSYPNVTLPMTISSNTTIDGTVSTNIQGTQYMKINAPAGVKVKMYMNDYYYVEYYAKAGVQEFDTMAWQNSSNHYARYEFSNIPSGQTVQIQDLKFRQTGYDTSIIGTFNSNDSSLNTLWTKAKNTSYVCMRDYFMDCPNRERGQWWGDVSEQILFSFYLYDTNANLLAKKGFRELFYCQKADGSLYTTAPGQHGEFDLPTQNMTAAIALWDYYMYTGDSALLSELYPNFKKYINNIASHRNADGMVVQQSNAWNWIDWGTNRDDTLAVNTVENAIFINLLTVAKNIATLTGNSSDVSYYQGLQDSVKNKFNTYFWNSSKNAYVYSWNNGVQSSVSDDRSNAWAALCGMADSAKVAGVLNVLNLQYDCSPYQERYVEDALFVLGADTQALARMRNRHKDMINSWSSTLWEEYPATNSNNHAWSCGPLYLLDSYALGIKPTSAGYSQFKYEPHLGGLTSLSATIPSVKGNITASISSTGSQYTQNLTAPTSTSAIVGIPKNAFASSLNVIDTIKVGSTVIYQNGAYIGGVSGVSFNSEDSNYIRFNVNSGSWSFIATSKVQSLTTVISDNFDDNSIDSAKWNVIERGLESNWESGLTAQETGSQISLSGTSIFNYWAGKTLQSKSTFTATGNNPLSFEVDRTSLSGSGIYRSSIWLWKSPTQYIHVGQDIGEKNWAYNVDGGTGEGTQIWNDSNTGLRKLKLVHDGSNVYVFIDGTQYIAIPVSWNSGFRVMLTGQTRASGNTVNAVFDNFVVKTTSSTASVPTGYTYCADENGTFTLSGTYDVAYGANGAFRYLYGQTGTTTFNNTTFGIDPIPNVAKKGYYKTSTAPAGYSYCAEENASYTLNGVCDVAYGANGQFYYKYSQTGTITFNNTTFGGDPIPNVAKKGYFKPSGVAFYADYNYGGTAVTLGKGSYTLAQMNALGLPDNWLSSLKVPNGWTVELYQDDNFTGTKWVYTEDSSYIGATANDKTTSIKIY